MILAAGRGERMRPLTDHCPKPLLEAGGKPLIAWHLEALAAAGFDEVVVNHAHLGPMIEQALGDGSRWGLRLSYSPEQRALETAGGIARALPRLGPGPFLVVNGDVFCDYPFARARDIAQRLRDDALLAWTVLVPNPPHHPDGDFALVGDRLADEGGERLTFSGIGVYAPELFAGLDGSVPAKLAPLLRAAATRRQVGAERHDGRWTDVGTPQRLAELDAQLRT
ncbi:MAG: nucleotidyltransferase family protein [Limnobacter sp.]|nr:nucleotidyltransferase family protein [Limnobacter sp.]